MMGPSVSAMRRNMRTLWRKTSELFWQHGVLWLPVFVADLFSFGIDHLRKPLFNLVVTPLLTNHSIITGAQELTTDKTKIFMGEVSSMLIIAFLELISIVAFVSAFFATAKLVKRKLGYLETDAREVGLTHILGLCVRASVIVAPLALCGFLVTTYFPIALHRFNLLLHSYATQVEGLLVMALIAYLLTPGALRAIAEPEGHVIDQETKSQGRQAALLAVVVSAVLLAFVTMAENSLLATPGQWFFIYLVASPITAMPYIPLYIALTLLAVEGSKEVRPATLEVDAG
jgi:hypothetical protein